MDLSDWETNGPPTWARKPLAWAACLIDALPLAIASLAFFQWRVGAVSVVLGVGLYLVIAGLLAVALRPWKSGDERPALENTGRRTGGHIAARADEA